jgi:GxxExxY protein
MVVGEDHGFTRGNEDRRVDLDLFLGTKVVALEGYLADTSQMQDSQLTGSIIQSAMRVHSELGPGLLESIYETSLEFELNDAGMRVDRQINVPVLYKGRELGIGFRADLIVENRVIIELKSVEQLLAIHRAQLVTYLKILNMSTGLLINFNTAHLRDGIRRCYGR